jgi:hypothetical protein
MSLTFAHIACVNTIKEKTVDMALRIAALKTTKIFWPDEFDRDDTRIYTISLDGVHFQGMEVTHPFLSKDPSWYSHKGNGPGLAYLMALDIRESQIVYFSGAKKASTHDKRIFLEPNGLRDRMRVGKKGIGDKAFRGKEGDGRVPISCPNSHNHPDVRKFQARGRARQETLFGRMKGSFQIMAQRFRFKDVDMHQIVFEAVVVLLQYQFDNGRPLFDV